MLLLSLVWGAAGAGAEVDKRRTPPLPPVNPAPSPAPAPAPETTPSSDREINRLAELLGILAFMRDLCGAGDGAAWRDKMASLLAAEAATGLRKERLAGSFNRGFQGYRLTYRTCTPAARAVIGRSLAEGERLSATLSRGFGPD